MIFYTCFHLYLLSCCHKKNYIKIMVLIPYQPIKLFKGTLLFNLSFCGVLFFFFFTLEPGSPLSEKSWHPVRRCDLRFHAGLKPKCTWSSPLLRFFFEAGRSPSLCWGGRMFFTLLGFLLNWERSLNLHIFLHWIIVMPSSHTPEDFTWIRIIKAGNSQNNSYGPSLIVNLCTTVVIFGKNSTYGI